MRFVNAGEERASIRRRWKFHWYSLAMEKTPGSLALLHCVNSTDMRRYWSACRSSGHTHVLVRSAIIKKPASSIANESLHKHDISYLSDSLAFGPWRKNGLLAQAREPCRIILVEQDPTSRVNVFVAGAVIHQQNAFRRKNNVNFLGWRARVSTLFALFSFPF